MVIEMNKDGLTVQVTNLPAQMVEWHKSTLTLNDVVNAIPALSAHPEKSA